MAIYHGQSRLADLLTRRAQHCEQLARRYPQHREYFLDAAARDRRDARDPSLKPEEIPALRRGY